MTNREKITLILSSDEDYQAWLEQSRRTTGIVNGVLAGLAVWGALALLIYWVMAG